jgi:uncharacterized membrane protein YfcA
MSSGSTVVRYECVPRLVVIGVAAGFFSALFGVGGGILIVPLLIVVSRFGERQAIATSLAAIGLTALAGTLRYAFEGAVEVEYAALVGLPAAAGAVAGASLQQRVNSFVLPRAFAGLLVVVAVLLLFE